MEKTRVKKGEKYWSVVYTSREGFAPFNYTETDDECDILDYERGNYFATFKEAEAFANKLRAVLKGADVIETHYSSFKDQVFQMVLEQVNKALSEQAEGFKAYLEAKLAMIESGDKSLDDFGQGFDRGKVAAYKGIINELFKED